MTDELVFPANDALSMIGDLSSNMLNEDVLAHDINPSFPQTEGSINIPEIIPPIISPKGTANNFKQTTDQTYTPISQLMKQTEELAATLDGPLNSNINEQINFNHIHTNSGVVQEPLIGQHMSNPLVNNSINFVNPSSHVPISPVQNTQNTQCLVIGGQRIPISAQNQHISSVINIKHAHNSSSPLIQTCSSHAMHSNSTINASSDIKQTMMVKVPMNQNQGTQNPNKPPMKGQIIKTPDQRLMFVTEVNGRRVGYLIQQPKQAANVSQTPVTQIQTPTQNVLNQHFDNRSNQEDSTMNSDNLETANNVDKLKSTTSEAINFTLDENKEIIMTHSENLNKVTEQPLLKTDMKSLREKLLNLRNPLNTKNQLNLKSCLTFPSMSKNDEKSSTNAEMNVDKPASPNNELPSTTLNSSSPIPSPQSISANDSMEVEHVLDDKVESPEKEDINYDDIEEEEGQEIEFSENDLTAEFDDNPIDLTDQQGDADNVEDNAINHARGRTVSTDDEDCMPLSMLRHDVNDDSMSPVENTPIENVSKPKKVKNKKIKQPKEVLEGDISKKKEDGDLDGKSKKKGKSKIKKKKDSRKPKKPIIAYQLFFREVQKDVRAENPQLSFGEISKEVSKKWESLDEADKKKYHDTHEASKLEYAEKLKAYKELVAQEKVSVGSPADSPLQLEPPDDENVFEEENKSSEPAQKKKVKRGKKRKLVKSTEPKEEFVESKEDLEKDVVEETPNEVKMPGKKLIVKKPLKVLDHPPSSPSLPSSASSSDAEEEDSESAITRIREKAAELHKYLKQQRFVVTQKKSKQPGKKARPGKSQLDDEDDDEIETVKAEDVDITDKTEVGEAPQMDHKLKICMKEEGLNIIVKEKLEEVETVDHDVEGEEDNEGTDTADEVKDLLEENASALAKKELEEDELKMSDHVMEEKVKKSMMEKSSNKVKKLMPNDDNDESSDDEKISPTRRKKSSRIKKLEETAARESENESPKNSAGRLRKRKTVKEAVDDTPKSESDDESIHVGRRKSSRKKNFVDIAQSDSEEEVKEPEQKNSISETPTPTPTPPPALAPTPTPGTTPTPTPTPAPKPTARQDPRKQKLVEVDNEDAKKPSIKQNEKTPAPSKEEPKSPVSETQSPQTEEPKSVTTTTAETSLKNTFRIPKKSGANNENGLMAFRGPRICIRQTCEKPAVTSRERGGQYCGNECLVLFCREIFESWVTDREVEEKNKT